MDRLTVISKKLGEEYRENKEAAAALALAKQEFFNEIDARLAAQPRRTIVVDYPFKAAMTKDYQKWIEENHPGFILKEAKLAKAGQDFPDVKLSLIEDPKYQKFTYVNKEEGLSYSRNIIRSSVDLDAEKLKRDHPEVWKRITYPVFPSDAELDMIAYVGKFTPEEMAEYVAERMQTDEDNWPVRELDYENIDLQDQSILEKYMTYKLVPKLEIRKAKKEELEHENDE